MNMNKHYYYRVISKLHQQFFPISKRCYLILINLVYLFESLIIQTDCDYFAKTQRLWSLTLNIPIKKLDYNLWIQWTHHTLPLLVNHGVSIDIEYYAAKASEYRRRRVYLALTSEVSSRSLWNISLFFLPSSSMCSSNSFSFSSRSNRSARSQRWSLRSCFRVSRQDVSELRTCNGIITVLYC